MAAASGDPPPRRLHDIRNHLSVIVGFCELLIADTPETDRVHRDLIEIRRAARAAIELLEDLDELP